MGLMGENGAGKSTMMKCLFGTYQKDEGKIFLNGKEISFSGPKDALENGIAMVHQELNQCLERSVIDNLFLGCLLYTSIGGDGQTEANITNRLGNPSAYDAFAINMVKTDNAASYTSLLNQ